MPSHNLDGMTLHFGADRHPFLTRKKHIPEYKNNYPFYMQPQSVRHVSVDILDMSVKADYEYYLKIWKAAGLGSVQVVDEEKKWVDATNNWKIFIRWYVKGKMDPTELRSELAKATRGLREGPEMLIEGAEDGI